MKCTSRIMNDVPLQIQLFFHVNRITSRKQNGDRHFLFTSQASLELCILSLLRKQLQEQEISHHTWLGLAHMFCQNY